jgi:cytochrome c peroxidase
MNEARTRSSTLLLARCLLLLGLPAALAACGSKTQSDEQVAAMLATAASATPARPTAVDAQTGAAAAKLNPRLLRRFKPVREAIEAGDNPITAAKVELGRMLYFEPRLSKNHDLSCNSCHALDRYGVDGQRTSPGHKGQRGQRNSPTVYNAAGHFAQFWDGRAATVEEQAKGPITNPIEMAMSDGQAVERTLRSIPEYVALFKSAFPGERQPVSYDNVGKAIGAFERGLVTPSRWDAYLKGDEKALSAQELDGLKVFTNVGCMVCHTGEFLGGSMFEKAGVVEEWSNQGDQGRLAVTKQEADRMMFKVPSLRNIAETAPYFHDGSAATLDDAVTMMGRHQLGLDLTRDERTAIVAWFGALTGELPKQYIQPPQLPASTAQTPAPNPT